MAVFTQIVLLAGALWSFSIPGGALSGMVGAAPWELSRCFLIFCFYLAAPGLACITRHRLVVLCQLSALACGIKFPDQRLKRASCLGSLESSPLDHQGSPSPRSPPRLLSVQEMPQPNRGSMPSPAVPGMRKSKHILCPGLSLALKCSERFGIIAEVLDQRGNKHPPSGPCLHLQRQHGSR